MTNGLCHTCYSSNVEITLTNKTGKPICNLCSNNSNSTPNIDTIFKNFEQIEQP